MQGIEMPHYMNERPRRRQKQSRDANQSAGSRPLQLLLLSVGLLCIIQATLNISLRLMSHSSKESTHPECNKTTFSEDELACKLQARFHASNRNRLENRNQELTNRIKTVEEERDRLKEKLRELTGCVSSQQCPAGWREINSRCYFLSRESKTWEDSRKDCQSKNADLVVIDSEQEQRALRRLGNPYSRFWIGLHDTTRTGTFKWVDGSALTKPFWRDGQPDHGHGCVRNREDCVEMNLDPVLNSWSDASCGFRLTWLCERGLCTD